jgi:hypothetical protein
MAERSLIRDELEPLFFDLFFIRTTRGQDIKNAV